MPYKMHMFQISQITGITPVHMCLLNPNAAREGIRNLFYAALGWMDVV